MTPPYPGHCLCGQVRFRLNAEPLALYACHCTDCQRRSGGAFLLSMWVPRDSLEVVAGSVELVSSIANDGRERRNRVCPACRIRLWSEPLHRPDLAILRPSMLEDAGSFAPIAHQFVRSALPWFVFPDDVARYETQPADPTEYTRLWKEARRIGAGPTSATPRSSRPGGTP